MKKVVFVSGHFNILHPGHIRLFRFAKELGDQLIVGVESDEMAGEAAYVPEELRLEGVLANSFIDNAFIIYESIEKVLMRIKPDFVVKGKEYELKENPEVKMLQEYGGQLIFSSGAALFTSFDLIQKELNDEINSNIKLPVEYINRHKININTLKQLVENFSNLEVLVLGDLIVDEYISCEPLGMSQEDPTIVVTPIKSTKFIGGAGIVAAHAAQLGAKVHFLSVIGIDETGIFAKSELKKFNVQYDLIEDLTRPTTLKQRFRSKEKCLLRVNHLHQNEISSEIEDIIFKKVESLLTNVKLVVLSDFNYGCLPQTLVDKLVTLAKGKGIYVAADSQSSSQIGDVARFNNVNLLTPTEHEARLSLRDRESGLIVLAERLRIVTNSENLLLKLGGDGLLVHVDGSKDKTWLTDRVSALNTNPKDISGAGDSLLIVGAMTLTLGANIWMAALLGSLAAAIQVSRTGNIPIKQADLQLLLKQ